MRVTIVIPASNIKSANTWMKESIDKVGGERTFRHGLSADGQTPATHYWTCFGFLSEKVYSEIKTNLKFSATKDVKSKVGTKVGGNVYIDTTNDDVLVAEGLKVIESDID